MPADPIEEFGAFLKFVEDQSPTDARRAILEKVVAEPLKFAPGSDYSYSNTGYIIAGAVAERAGGATFEDLLAERVFKPLGVQRFGFGPKGVDGDGDAQIWGHHAMENGLSPSAPWNVALHNPAAYNSAGNIRISLADWALFARDQLSGREGAGKLFDASYYERLQTPFGGQTGYAMGWGVLVAEGNVNMLTHNGGDGNWFADIRAYPQTDLLLLVVMNDGRDAGEAKAAAADIRKAFSERYSPIP